MPQGPADELLRILDLEASAQSGDRPPGAILAHPPRRCSLLPRREAGQTCRPAPIRGTGTAEPPAPFGFKGLDGPKLHLGPDWRSSFHPCTDPSSGSPRAPASSRQPARSRRPASWRSREQAGLQGPDQQEPPSIRKLELEQPIRSGRDLGRRSPGSRDPGGQPVAEGRVPGPGPGAEGGNLNA